jgi:hypothetical protein
MMLIFWSIIQKSMESFLNMIITTLMVSFTQMPIFAILIFR